MLLEQDDVDVLYRHSTVYQGKFVKFEITSTNNRVQIYDNVTNDIEGKLDNVDLLRSAFPQKSQPIIFSRSFPSKKRLLGRLRIFVGQNCNYRCAFCTQYESKFSSAVVKKDGVDQFFKMLDAAGVELDEKCRIELWGGEPLIYQKTLKFLIPELRRRYPKATIWTISNGSLMREEILDFFIKYRVSLTFSHDAQAYFLRGKDPLDDPKMLDMWREVVRCYKEAGFSFGINTVISQYNCDLKKIEEFFAEKLPGVSYGFEGVVNALTNNAIQFCTFDAEHAQILHDSVVDALLNGKKSLTFDALLSRFERMIRRLIWNTSNMVFRGRCDAGGNNTLAVDLHGNVLSCHNVVSENWFIGHLNDFDSIKPRFYHWLDRDNCSLCPFLIGCQGNCPRNNNQSHNAACGVSSVFYGAIFQAAWKALTGADIATIKRIS